MNARRNTQRRNHMKEGRKEIEAPLYKRGWSIAKIAEEVRTRLNTTCSTRTVWNDINEMLEEWRATRIDDVDQRLQLELERIDDAVRELWEQWDKSKENWVKENNKRVGVPVPQTDENGQPVGEATEIATVRRENKTENVIGLGDPRYIAEIRQQLAERRKLLGLYAPEKRDVRNELSFASFLMESGMIDEAEAQIAKQGE
jgi:hypothetical protein